MIQMQFGKESGAIDRHLGHLGTLPLFRSIVFIQYDEIWRHLKAFLNIIRFFHNFDGRHQIDAGHGTDSFASTSSAIFEFSSKSGRGKICQNAAP